PRCSTPVENAVFAPAQWCGTTHVTLPTAAQSYRRIDNGSIPAARREGPPAATPTPQSFTVVPIPYAATSESGWSSDRIARVSVVSSYTVARRRQESGRA